MVIAKKEKPIIKSIKKRLIGKVFTNKELRPQIFIQFLIHNEKKYDLAISKSIDIRSKLVADQYQPIIEGKMLMET